MSFTAQLVLKSGEVFYGEAPAKQEKITYGEVVFNTGMVGYVESLTDPSYAGQILVFTYPLIGNYGVAGPEHWESAKIHVRGAIFSEIAPHFAHHDAQGSLSDWLTSQQIPFLTHVDTRALTKALRSKGVVPGAIAIAANNLEEEQHLQQHGHHAPHQFEDFEDRNWVADVSIKEPLTYGHGDKLIIAIDCGMKENILRSLAKFPVRIKRVPYDYDFTAEHYDGVFVSNGPGDPQQVQATIAILRRVMEAKKPIFGICLGTQLMALAAGAKTFKLPFGHRSHNQPCLHIPSNLSYLTSQNHGYAILEESLPTDWQVTFRNLNDGSVAGIAHRSLPFFSVQFHPEASPGPEDTHWLFQKFYDLLS